MAITIENFQAFRDLIMDEGIQNAPFEDIQYKLYSNLKVFVDDTELAIDQFQASPADYKAERLTELGAGVPAKLISIKNGAVAMITAIEELHALNDELMPGLIKILPEDPQE